MRRRTIRTTEARTATWQPRHGEDVIDTAGDEAALRLRIETAPPAQDAGAKDGSRGRERAVLPHRHATQAAIEPPSHAGGQRRRILGALGLDEARALHPSQRQRVVALEVLGHVEASGVPERTRPAQPRGQRSAHTGEIRRRRSGRRTRPCELDARAKGRAHPAVFQTLGQEDRPQAARVDGLGVVLEPSRQPGLPALRRGEGKCRRKTQERSPVPEVLEVGGDAAREDEGQACRARGEDPSPESGPSARDGQRPDGRRQQRQERARRQRRRRRTQRDTEGDGGDSEETADLVQRDPAGGNASYLRTEPAKRGCERIYGARGRSGKAVLPPRDSAFPRSPDAALQVVTRTPFQNAMRSLISAAAGLGSG